MDGRLYEWARSLLWMQAPFGCCLQRGVAHGATELTEGDEGRGDRTRRGGSGLGVCSPHGERSWKNSQEKAYGCIPGHGQCFVLTPRVIRHFFKERQCARTSRGMQICDPMLQPFFLIILRELRGSV